MSNGVPVTTAWPPAECRCVTCPECKGSGVVWFTFGGKEYLGSRRCEDLDEMETCDECRGAGVSDVCEKCAMEFEDEMNEERLP